MKAEADLSSSAFLFFVSLVLFAGCSPAEKQENIIARVNDRILTVEMVKAQLDPSQPLTPEVLQQFAREWTTNELLHQEATSKGFDASSEVEQRIEETRRRLSIAALLESEVYEEEEISAADILAYYQDHLQDFVIRETTVWLSTAMFSDGPSATQFRISCLTGPGWDESLLIFQSDTSNLLSAKSDSVFTTASTLYPPELWRVATVLKRLDVSFPIRTSAGFFILRSLGTFQAGSPAPLQMVDQEIRQRITMERRQQRYIDYLETLRKRNSVQIFLPQSDTLMQSQP